GAVRRRHGRGGDLRAVGVVRRLGGWRLSAQDSLRGLVSALPGAPPRSCGERPDTGAGPAMGACRWRPRVPTSRVTVHPPTAAGSVARPVATSLMARSGTALESHALAHMLVQVVHRVLNRLDLL